MGCHSTATAVQEASQRSLDRCSEAEREIETLRNRLAELEGQDSSRDAVVALETKVDELEEVGIFSALRMFLREVFAGSLSYCRVKAGKRLEEKRR